METVTVKAAEFVEQQNELKHLRQRVADLEFEKEYAIRSLEWDGDGYRWSPPDWDYRAEPEEVLTWERSHEMARRGHTHPDAYCEKHGCKFERPGGLRRGPIRTEGQRGRSR